MESNVADTEDAETPTFNDLLDEQGHLPDVQTSDKLWERLLQEVYGQDETGHHFTEVALTYRPPRGHDYKTIEDRTSAGGLQYGRVKPEIGFQEFWHPINAPLPVVAFKCKEEGGHRLVDKNRSSPPGRSGARGGHEVPRRVALPRDPRDHGAAHEASPVALSYS